MPRKNTRPPPPAHRDTSTLGLINQTPPHAAPTSRTPNVVPTPAVGSRMSTEGIRVSGNWVPSSYPSVALVTLGPDARSHDVPSWRWARVVPSTPTHTGPEAARSGNRLRIQRSTVIHPAHGRWRRLVLNLKSGTRELNRRRDGATVGATGMAQGGRGWFHRKRHQPEPEQPTGTTHASSLAAAQPLSRIHRFHQLWGRPRFRPGLRSGVPKREPRPNLRRHRPRVLRRLRSASHPLGRQPPPALHRLPRTGDSATVRKPGAPGSQRPPFRRPPRSGSATPMLRLEERRPVAPFSELRPNHHPSRPRRPRRYHRRSCR